jgi:RNA methyltransferase, TrmH family
MTAPLDRINRARRDPDLAVLEGFHALKHALRFGADVELVLARDPEALEELARTLAPDLAGRFTALAERCDDPELLHTEVIAVARRRSSAPSEIVDRRREAPVVLLEDPRHLGNVGAVIRVAAAADAVGVLTTGRADPWDPAALRGSAGLHYALPVGRTDAIDPRGRPLVAIDPDGEPLTAIPPGAVLAFGTERHGLSADLLQRADARVGIPMRRGVSSLNLATAVAVILFVERLPRR